MIGGERENIRGAMNAHKAKRAKKLKNGYKIFIISLIAVILVLVIILALVRKNRYERTLEGEIPQSDDVVISTEHVENENYVEKIEKVDVSDMPETMGGYTVIGKIVIDKLGVKSYILRKDR